MPVVSRMLLIIIMITIIITVIIIICRVLIKCRQLAKRPATLRVLVVGCASFSRKQRKVRIRPSIAKLASYFYILAMYFKTSLEP